MSLVHLQLNLTGFLRMMPNVQLQCTEQNVKKPWLRRLHPVFQPHSVTLLFAQTLSKISAQICVLAQSMGSITHACIWALMSLKIKIHSGSEQGPCGVPCTVLPGLGCCVTQCWNPWVFCCVQMCCEIGFRYNTDGCGSRWSMDGGVGKKKKWQCSWAWLGPMQRLCDC